MRGEQGKHEGEDGDELAGGGEVSGRRGREHGRHEASGVVAGKVRDSGGWVRSVRVCVIPPLRAVRMAPAVAPSDMSRIYQLKRQASGIPEAPPETAAIDFAAELNSQQLAAVTSPPGKALVLAGAGSGKTRTLTYRVAYLLENAIAPQNILLLTFTNKAAREMMERVDALLPGRTGGLWSGTFHSVCNRMLRRNAAAAGLTSGFTILDADDAKSLMTKVIRENAEIVKQVEQATGEKFPKAPVILGMLSFAVNTRTPLERVVQQRFSPSADVVEGIGRMAKHYEKRKRDANSADFDDLLTRTLEMFRAHPEVLAEYQYQFQFILVDEYQDTNPVQGELIDQLAGAHGNVMVVGDDAQSIYSWRGADFAAIIGFPERHAGAQLFKIETNYRSTPEILAVANAAIGRNTRQFAKELQPACASRQQKPVLAALYTPEEQAMFVAQRMQELHEEEGIPWHEMAVLYRAHFQSMEVQLQLTQAGIPFVVTSGIRFFESAHLKDFTAYLRLVVNPRDEAAFDRVVQMLPGVGAGTAAKLAAAWHSSDFARTSVLPPSFSALLSSIRVPARAQKDWEQLGYTMDEFLTPEGALQPPSVLLRSLWEGVYQNYLKTSYDNAETRVEDVLQFMNFAARYQTLPEMLSDLSLLSGPEQASGGDQVKDSECAVLSTVHQAKGLEWKVVFLVWLTQGMFPNMRAVEESGEEGLEEERRLFYVAVTRAREQLHLLFPRFWPKSYAGDPWQQPSQFLEEIPAGALDEWRIGRGY
jgi:DNA helicase-2/ATP-dependent DNA helicase PcrA